VLVLTCFVSTYSVAQGPSAPEAKSSAEAFTFDRTPTAQRPPAHGFWDRKNGALFIASTALGAADFAVTRANLQNGGRELNPFVRVFGKSTPGLAMNLFGQTAGVIGVSYLFHKTGHHKIERISSLVNIGASGAAVAYGLKHR